MAPQRRHRLGWIGLGRMGYALAERLVKAGAEVRGYNRTREKAAPLEALGVVLVDHPSELADCDIVFTMVSTADDLREVTAGANGLFSGSSSPSILVELSTISAADSEAMRALAKSHGCEMLVLPVSGNDVVARAGKLSIIASGPRIAFDEAFPYLSALGADVTYVGEGDLSRTIKICHNLYLGICYAALAEISVLAEKSGVPRNIFMSVINKSVLGSSFSKYKTPVISNLDYTVTFTTELMLKDMKLGLKAADATGTWIPTTRSVHDLYQSSVNEGRSQLDYTTVLDKLAQKSGLPLASESADVTDGLA